MTMTITAGSSPRIVDVNATGRLTIEDDQTFLP